MNETVSLHDLYRDYRDQVQFLMIYIREAHPRDGWWLGGGLPGIGLKLSGSKASTEIFDPKTMHERRDVANQCVTALECEIPTLVDGIDDPVNQACAGLPTRLYLIDLEGVVASNICRGKACNCTRCRSP